MIGLVPAAGGAARLGALPCSKEIFPLGIGPDGRTRPVCEHLLDAYLDAGVERAFVLLRKGKWDIPQLLGRGRRSMDAELRLAYLALDPTASVPETLDAAYPFVTGARVALGFPDILFEPRDAFRSLVERQEESGADLVLGLFPADRPDKADMVELDDDGRVRRLIIKQPDADLRFTWSIALWTPAFSRYLHDFVARQAKAVPLGGSRGGSTAGDEIHVGDVIQAAVDEGWAVEAVPHPEGSYLDVGTPEDLVRALGRSLAAPEVRVSPETRSPLRTGSRNAPV